MAPYLVDLDTRLAESGRRMDALLAEVGAAGRELAAVRAELRDANARAGEELTRVKGMLRAVYEEDTAMRRCLYALRASEEYELAFTETEPLVSFVVPTYNRFESLRDLSLPSILSQTYSNLEVIVTGDGAPPATEEIVSGFGDARVRYCNRTVRGPYPDKDVRWYVIGTPPYNDGVALARGRWIGTLGDDDEVRPEHAELLVKAAQEHRYEHCFGRHQVHYKGGETLDVGGFPPQKGEFVLQSSLYHAGLRFFQMEPVDYLAREPNDWSLCRRMLAAGVRFGMVDEIVADRHESRYEFHADWERGVPSVE